MVNWITLWKEWCVNHGHSNGHTSTMKWTMQSEQPMTVLVTTATAAIHEEGGVAHGVIPPWSEQYGNTVISIFVEVLNQNEERKPAVQQEGKAECSLQRKEARGRRSTIYCGLKPIPAQALVNSYEWSDYYYSQLVNMSKCFSATQTTPTSIVH